MTDLPLPIRGVGHRKANKRGLFIVIEGIDGSGKATQAKLLHKKLVDEGYDVAEFSFPQYDLESSYFVKQYLNGKYGGASEVGPYTGSLFYALDRFEASMEIRNAIEDGKIVIADRYTGSNMAHQGTKFDNVEERKGYFLWLDQLEFDMLKIPRPDFSFVLSIPAEIAQKQVSGKSKRNYTNKKYDLHEQDLTHLKRSAEVYGNMCQLFPKDFKLVDCARNGDIMSIEAIHDLLLEDIRPLLPVKAKHGSTASIHQVAQNPYLKRKEDGGLEITDSGKNFLEKIVTNVDGDVYSFSDKLSPLTIAAAMARLSRRGDDMRVTILDEFTLAMGKDEDLLKRVITAFGDDSVQQLVSQHIVVENASNLLTKKLEWGRLAAYLEQSTRYIYYDEKNSSDKYKYYTPAILDVKTRDTYNRVMDQIFELYSHMVKTMTAFIGTTSSTPKKERDSAWRIAVKAQACDSVRGVLPVATQATVGIFGSGQAIESLIMHILSDELPEAKETGQKILGEARKNISVFLERADRPDRGGATIAYMAQTKHDVARLADKYLNESYSSDQEPVALVSYWPKNELDIIADILYEHSNSSLKEIRKEVEKWSYKRKTAIFHNFFGERLNRRHKPGRALEKIHYSWDLLCDYGIFRDLQRHRIVDDLNWQQLSPRYGYEMPPIIEKAGLAEAYETCFDLSLNLYSKLQSSGYALESQYVTLLGHRMRWKTTFNAREALHLIELRTSPQGHPGYRKLAKLMYEKIAEVHPLVAEAMQFVDKDEDPELTRLAAERYTKFKLSQINS